MTLDASELYAGMLRVSDRASSARRIESQNGWPRFAAVREFYRLALPDIESSDPRIWAIDPYEVDWTRIFTPIERALWHDIRAHGMVMYPQFPVGPYFADFCNPVAHVVIECDGKKWHTDAAKDRQRDAFMLEQGFSVYRFPGALCFTDELDSVDADGVDRILPGEASVKLREICAMHSVSHGRHA